MHVYTVLLLCYIYNVHLFMCSSNAAQFFNEVYYHKPETSPCSDRVVKGYFCAASTLPFYFCVLIFNSPINGASHF